MQLKLQAYELQFAHEDRTTARRNDYLQLKLRPYELQLTKVTCEDTATLGWNDDLQLRVGAAVDVQVCT